MRLLLVGDSAPLSVAGVYLAFTSLVEVNQAIKAVETLGGMHQSVSPPICEPTEASKFNTDKAHRLL